MSDESREAGGDFSVPRPPEDVTPTDPNLVAVRRANLPDDLAGWLDEVAAQVDPRLDRVAPDWRGSDQAEAARACVFGLLLGYLGRTYPHVRGELSHVAEAHPSFSTLESGSRLATLEQIVADPGRVAAWLGPLIDVDDPERMRAIIE